MPRLQLRRGTAAAWTSADPTLAEGEEGYETDTGKRKIGDGSTAWTGLSYMASGGAAALDDLTDVNAPSPTDQYVLTWDDGAGEWIAATPAGGAPIGTAGGVLSGTYPNPGFAADMATQAELDAHTGDTTDAHDASAVSFAPAGTIASTDVQGALEELDGDSRMSDSRAPTGSAGGDLSGTYPNPSVAATHSGSAHHDPVTVGTGLDVTGQLVELDLSEVAAGGELGGFMDAPTVDATHSGSSHAATQAAAEATAASALSGHTGDTSDAHDASAISFSPAGTISATDVQAAIEEVAAEASGASFATPAIVLGSSAAAGAASTVIRSDSTIVAFDATSPSTQAFGDSAVVGTAAFAAHRDHKHGMPSSTGTKITGLSAATPVSTDVIPYVSDPSGTPVTKKTTVANLLGLAGGLTTGGGNDIDINVDTNYVTIGSLTTTIAAGDRFIVEAFFITNNNTGGTKTYTTCLDINGFLMEVLDGGTQGANATNSSYWHFAGAASVRSTSLAWGGAGHERQDVSAAATAQSNTNAQARKTWNTSTSDLTGASKVVAIKIKTSATGGTSQTVRVLAWTIRKV